MQTTKKFWCHYIGNDGNTPKRRNIELTNLAVLFPNIDNETCETPLWYETEVDESYSTPRADYILYAQLSDNVAVMVDYLTAHRLENMVVTDEQIETEQAAHWANWLKNHPDASDEYRQREETWCKENVEGRRRDRDRLLAQLASLQDTTNRLLGGSWVTASMLRAYEEIGSPALPKLVAIREQAIEERKHKEQAEQEERRRKQEEEARKQAEADAREQERLTQEGEKFKAGQSIAGSDVVDLCRRHGIAIHLRTVHNLQQVIVNINGKDSTCQYYRTRGKRRPQLDGCYKTARELYEYLQTV